jgi:hypothetical protein
MTMIVQDLYYIDNVHPNFYQQFNVKQQQNYMILVLLRKFIVE